MYILFVENLVALFTWKAALYFPEILGGGERINQWLKENYTIKKNEAIINSGRT